MRDNKGNMKKIYILFFPVLLLLASCEVEFSPNAEWKEVPVVYCVLDQDDDTTWARVEKCYLGDGDIYSYSSISDSFNYPEGYLQVALLAYKNGQIVDSMPFTDSVVDRENGDFVATDQPVFFCRTRNRLDVENTYVLSVRRASDGSLLTTSQPVPLIAKTRDQVISKPTNTQTFGFYDHNSGSPTAFCRIEWPALQNARLYQPVIRFYYVVDGDTTYIDLKCSTVKGTANRVSYSTNYSRDMFLADVKKQLQDDPRQKYFAKKVDIYLMACSEELNAYMNAVSATSDIDQSHEVYTNMTDGLGIVAARRTHLYKRVPADTSVAPNQGLYYLLKNLGINMQ